MGNSKSSNIPSMRYLNPNETVSTQALAREWRNYVGNAELMPKFVAKKFLVDFCVLYGFPYPEDYIQMIDLDETREGFSWKDFKAFFVSSVEDKEIDLSESLKLAPMEQQESSSHSKRITEKPVMKEMVDVRKANTMLPRDENAFTPPSQMMTREWSVVFGFLSNKELNKVNLTCRFFRTVLFKYAPEHWRVARLHTLEQRTAEDMTGFTIWQRMRSIMRLEIGAPNFGAMLKDDDLILIFYNLENLRHLKLVFCHLLNEDGWLGIAHTKSSKLLR